MKRALILSVLVLAVHSFRQHAPPRPPPHSSADSDSSMSSEEDSLETVQQNKRIQPEEFMKIQKQQQEKPEEKPKKFFDRPSPKELEAYDQKVQRQNKNMKPKDLPIVVEEPPVMIHDPIDDIIRPKPKKQNMDDFDEKAFLATLGQMYLDKVDQESRDMDRFPGPIGPIGPVGPPMDFDYFIVPLEDDVPKQANNNGNNNVHVNVNHVQVNSNVLHVPEKNEKKIDGPLVHDAPPPPPPPVPYIQPYQEPISTSKYLYFNFNMADAVIVALLVAAFVFATKKAYQRCFPKKVAPQLPTTLPPTYSPSHIVVETTSKKVPQ